MNAGRICQLAFDESHGEKDMVMDVERLHQFLRNEKKKFSRIRKDIEEGRITAASKPYTVEVFKYLDTILKFRLVPIKLVPTSPSMSIDHRVDGGLVDPTLVQSSKRLKLLDPMNHPLELDVVERHHIHELTELKRKFDVCFLPRRERCIVSLTAPRCRSRSC
jgi:hypothetical protein